MNISQADLKRIEAKVREVVATCGSISASIETRYALQYELGVVFEALAAGKSVADILRDLDEWLGQD